MIDSLIKMFTIIAHHHGFYFVKILVTLELKQHQLDSINSLKSGINR